MKTYHLISGLPRSGSTLLSSILDQNSNIYATVSSPLQLYFQQIVNKTNEFSYTKYFMTDEKYNSVLKGLFDNFYYDIDKPICFDSNRAWPKIFHMVKHIFPEIKMICCVRDVRDILNSYELLFKKNPLIYSNLYGSNEYNDFDDVYKRSKKIYMELVSVYFSLRELKFSEYNKDVLFVDYENLCNQPEEVMEKIYNFLGVENFEHNFNNVQKSHKLYDDFLNAPNMHTVDHKVNSIRKNFVLPDELAAELNLQKFW